MTTKLILKNADHSNGDLEIEITSYGKIVTALHLFPGQETEQYLHGEYRMTVHETWPSQRPVPEGEGNKIGQSHIAALAAAPSVTINERAHGHE